MSPNIRSVIPVLMQLSLKEEVVRTFQRVVRIIDDASGLVGRRVYEILRRLVPIPVVMGRIPIRVVTTTSEQAGIASVSPARLAIVGVGNPGHLLDMISGLINSAGRLYAIGILRANYARVVDTSGTHSQHETSCQSPWYSCDFHCRLPP
jgi:hypothetical protein